MIRVNDARTFTLSRLLTSITSPITACISKTIASSPYIPNQMCINIKTTRMTKKTIKKIHSCIHTQPPQHQRNPKPTLHTHHAIKRYRKNPDAPSCSPNYPLAHYNGHTRPHSANAKATRTKIQSYFSTTTPTRCTSTTHKPRPRAVRPSPPFGI